ncbi:MAG: YidC/Oxa1 family membrane protein insertase [Eubacteriales bacterium]|jgi:YidC/Oxa1 family membrane protein insertase|uniref:Membrane protein insertase YidC n=1 Tax=Baileyella intestinalis TaxID=2606709 RepID=A0A6A8M621_9FIRM|nr:YidC/Oxa1 family membrane protein insertase [Baileyella intestinalis]MCI7686054.1 YidC/Oxa1 family membrane protein insertase [Clostridiales bacterium]MDD5875747.1 YidC/Oxa1 family membrane protein insertase [Baileyella intestinalis]MDY2994991.1 YidC/Oxa1 family membrane protein insertase [Baileyella intestinalis]MST68785.1 membrane protein insertase YidC [Baileyella intestinalis]
MNFLGIIAKPLGMLLTLIYSLVGNYGISLIILTVLVKCIMYPLYVKQIKATAGMAAVQPKMQEIQKKYANDQQKMSEEMQKLYSEEGFNPMGGCLPMLIQFPIIMGLFQLLRNPMLYMTDKQMLFAIHEPFLWIKDLAQPDLWILPILAGVSTYFSFSMTSKLTTDQGNMQTQAMQKVMKYFFPLTILWIGRSYPAGLAIYWAGGQFLQIFFNLRMNKIRREMNEKAELEKMRARAEKELEKKKAARMKGKKR